MCCKSLSRITPSGTRLWWWMWTAGSRSNSRATRAWTGAPLDQIRADLAALAGCSTDRVRVALAAPRSGRVIVYGPVRGRARVVPYQGPEPVIDFLKRVGGLPPGSRLSQVYVVRPNVAAATRPQVFRVDVTAVLMDGDTRTNIPLQADDQVYVGETRESSFSRLLPDWLAIAYRRLSRSVPGRLVAVVDDAQSAGSRTGDDFQVGRGRAWLCIPRAAEIATQVRRGTRDKLRPDGQPPSRFCRGPRATGENRRADPPSGLSLSRVPRLALRGNLGCTRMRSHARP